MSDTTLGLNSAATPSFLARLKGFFALKNRYLPLFLVTCILLVGQMGFGFLESFSRTMLAIGCSVAAEIVLCRWVLGKWPHLGSAYMSGISVGVLIRSPAFWPYAMCALISTSTKYAVRWHGRHIFNPSNFGVCAMLVLAPTAVATLSVQWGNSLLPMVLVWVVGSWIIWKIGFFHVCLTYVASFLALAFVRSAVTGTPWLTQVAPLTGPMYQLFVFFMITDPKTNPHTKWGRCLVAFLVAVVEMILRLMNIVNAPFFALFLVGPPATILEIWWTYHRKGKPTTPEPSGGLNSPQPGSSGLAPEPATA